jgi:uncharacterized membrane protein
MLREDGMSLVHLHLLLNHVPVVGAVFGLLFLVVALVRRDGALAKVSFAFLALVGAVSVAVFMTGEPAQEAIEKLPGFSERLIDRHEDAALLATIVAGTMGALALASLILYRRRALPRWLTMLGLVAAVGASAMMAYTANLGGQIRHSEIRAGAASPVVDKATRADEAADER